MKITAALLILLAMATVSGGLSIEQEFFVNPDSAGKVLCKITVTTPPGINDTANKYGFTPEKLLAEKIQEQLSKYKGIELWKNITYYFSEDKKLFYYNCTGYFRKLNECYFNVPQLGIKPRYGFYKNINGEIEIVLETTTLNGMPGQAELSEERKTQEMIEARIQYAKNRLEMPEYLKTIKIQNTFHLPANIRDYSNFRKTSANTAEIATDGKKILNAMNAAINNDSWLGERVKYSTNVFDAGWDYKMNKEIFGTKAAASLLLYPGSEKLFDYETEISATSEDKHTQDELNNEADSNYETNDYYKLPVGVADYRSPVNLQLQKAVKATMQNDFKIAVQLYMNIVANENIDDKYLARTYYQLGMCLFNNGFTQQAIEMLNYVIDNFALETATAIKASEKVQLIYSGKAIAENIDSAQENKSPTITATVPKQFREGVSKGTKKIVLKFNTAMAKYRWYYSSVKGCELPKATQNAFFDETMKIWTLPVSLEPAKTYAIAINYPGAIYKKNRQKQRGFVSKDGVAAETFVLVFTTEDKEGNAVFIKDDVFDRVGAILKNASH